MLKKKTIRLNVDLPEEMYKDLKKELFESNKKISVKIRELIEHYLQKKY